jgi:hypothetical protein
LELALGALGCATQQATSQAMTIAGAAAVVVGASIAADSRCHDVTPGGAGPAAFCSSGLSRGTRNVGTGVAVAGAALAAAGYALQPKGPDRLQGGGNALPVPAGPYRLVRPTPATPEAPAVPAVAAPPKEGCPAPAAMPGAEEPSENAAATQADDARPARERTPCAASSDETPPNVPPEPSQPPSAGEPPAPLP